MQVVRYRLRPDAPLSETTNGHDDPEPAQKSDPVKPSKDQAPLMALDCRTKDVFDAGISLSIKAKDLRTFKVSPDSILELAADLEYSTNSISGPRDAQSVPVIVMATRDSAKGCTLNIRRQDEKRREETKLDISIAVEQTGTRSSLNREFPDVFFQDSTNGKSSLDSHNPPAGTVSNFARLRCEVSPQLVSLCAAD